MYKIAISDEDRQKLLVAKVLLESVKRKIDDKYKEYRLIDTAIDSIEYAIKKNLDD